MQCQQPRPAYCTSFVAFDYELVVILLLRINNYPERLNGIETDRPTNSSATSYSLQACLVLSTVLLLREVFNDDFDEN